MDKGFSTLFGILCQPLWVVVNIDIRRRSLYHRSHHIRCLSGSNKNGENLTIPTAMFFYDTKQEPNSKRKHPKHATTVTAIKSSIP